MLDLAVLGVFIPTFFFVSITPGMCMTLSMTLGMRLGVVGSLPFMWGELLGIGLIVIASALGISGLMLDNPDIFFWLKLMGGMYLIYVGLQMWMSKGRLALCSAHSGESSGSAYNLASQGFITAIANPKSWAFYVSLLPPFISVDHSIPIQLVVLVVLILIIEFACLLIYASGGSKLNRLLLVSSNVRFMNRVAGSMIILVAVWLVFGH